MRIISLALKVIVKMLHDCFMPIKYIVWLIKGKPFVTYSGFNCGLCGKWHEKQFSIPTYKSAGEWWDTWGTCVECPQIVKVAMLKVDSCGDIL